MNGDEARSGPTGSVAQGRRGQGPLHVGIIMDGNGRWAAARGLPRFEGHRRGVEALRRTVEAADDLGIGYLTVYSFSSENWNRPEAEISDLMGLLKRFIRKDLANLHRNNVRVRVIGERDRLAGDIRALLREAESLTVANTGLQLLVAFNYGGRQEIASAMRRIAQRVARGEISPDDVTVGIVEAHLDTAGIPDPDLIIRTSGEQRLSNFLMWQTAYSEFVFLALHWPDFDRAALETALATFVSRERRFGGVTGEAIDRKVKTAL